MESKGELLLYHHTRISPTVTTGAGRLLEELRQPKLPLSPWCFEKEEQLLKPFGGSIAARTPAVCRGRGSYSSSHSTVEVWPWAPPAIGKGDLQQQLQSTVEV